MAIITAEIKLPELFQTVTVRLYYPTDLPVTVGNSVKGVITLLHGLGNTGTDWLQMTAACRYAADNGYVLVVPDTGNSFYNNMAYGPPWHTILTQLLPAQLEKIFKLPAEREKNYLAGLSMGGYGALRIGLSQPQRYAAVGSFSGALDLATFAAFVRQNPVMRPLLAPVLGDGLDLPDGADVFQLARQAAALPAGQQPRVFCTCGKQDAETLAANRAFAAAVKDLPLDCTYREWDGVHEWNFWDRSLAEFIGFIQGSSYGKRKRADWAAEAATPRL